MHLYICQESSSDYRASGREHWSSLHLLLSIPQEETVETLWLQAQGHIDSAWASPPLPFSPYFSPSIFSLLFFPPLPFPRSSLPSSFTCFLLLGGLSIKRAFLSHDMRFTHFVLFSQMLFGTHWRLIKLQDSGLGLGQGNMPPRFSTMAVRCRPVYQRAQH